MPSFSNRLINPTPFSIKLTHDRGVRINIPADGFAELTPEQTNQYRPDAPNTESVRDELGQHGIFLEDINRSFDEQALEAIEKAASFRRAMLNTSKSSLRREAAKNGAFSEESFNESLRQLGYDKLEEKVEALEKRVAMYKSKLSGKQSRPQERQLDPSRTLLFTDPPREFPSALAMEIYLEEHPDEKRQQKEWLERLKVAEREARTPSRGRNAQ